MKPAGPDDTLGEEPLGRLARRVGDELPAERDVDVYAALVATSEAAPGELPRALGLCGLQESDWARLRSTWRDKMANDAETSAAFSARLADHRALCRALLSPRPKA